MVMETLPGASLEMVQAQAVLGTLERLLGMPARMAQFRDGGLGERSRWLPTTHSTSPPRFMRACLPPTVLFRRELSVAVSIRDSWDHWTDTLKRE